MAETALGLELEKVSIGAPVGLSALAYLHCKPESLSIRARSFRASTGIPTVPIVPQRGELEPESRARAAKNAATL